MSVQKSKEFKERSEGHEEIWKCSLDEFSKKIASVLFPKISEGKVPARVHGTIIQMIREKFDKKLLKGTVEYEVNTVIDEALVYHANILGEDI